MGFTETTMNSSSHNRCRRSLDSRTTMLALFLMYVAALATGILTINFNDLHLHVDGFVLPAPPIAPSIVVPSSSSLFKPPNRIRDRNRSYQRIVPGSRIYVSIEDDIIDGSASSSSSSSDGRNSDNTIANLDHTSSTKRYATTKINNIQVLTSTNDSNENSNSNNNNDHKKKTRPVTFLDGGDKQDMIQARRAERAAAKSKNSDNSRPPNDDQDTDDSSNNALLEALESQQKELSSSLGALRQSLTEEQTKSQSLQERLERAEQIIAEQREELQRATQAQEQQVRALEGRLERAQVELEERLERERALEDQKAELVSQAMVVEQQETLQQQVGLLQTELDRAIQESEQTKREVVAVEVELSAARTQITSLQDQLESAQSKEGSYQGRTKNLENKLDVARQKLAVKQQALTKTQRELAQAQSKLDLQDKLNDTTTSPNRGGKAVDTSKTGGNDTKGGKSLFPNNFLGGAAAAAAASAAAKPINSLKTPSPNIARPAKSTAQSPKQLQYPVIQNWSVNEATGEVTGIVRNHPQISDGTKIVTSALANTRTARANAVVVTKSGSRYQLATPIKKLDGTRPPFPRRKASPASSQQQQQSSSSTPAASSKAASVTDGNEVEEKQTKKTPFNLFSGISSPVISAKKEQAELKNQQFPELEYPVTGEAVGSGKYLLAGRPKRKPSGRSEIVTAYLADNDRNPTGDPLAIKFSTHTEKLKGEYSNYLKIQQRGLLFGSSDQHQSPFVRWLDYMDRAEGSIKYAQHSAMVMELGKEDLREYRSRVGTMDDEEIKSALHTAAKCIEMLHRAKLIWTDCKAENFVRMDTGDENSVTFKGVDLESAMPLRGNPLDYTPEASPPEFAQAYLEGEAYDFVLDYSYDIWSFGMLAYELVHGQGYFGKKPPAQIVKTLALNFQPPKLQNFEDDQLRDLVERCLSLEPKKRPTASWILNHPYFKSEGGGFGLFGW